MKNSHCVPTDDTRHRRVNKYCAVRRRRLGPFLIRARVDISSLSSSHFFTSSGPLYKPRHCALCSTLVCMLHSPPSPNLPPCTILHRTLTRNTQLIRKFSYIFPIPGVEQECVSRVTQTTINDKLDAIRYQISH